MLRKATPIGTAMFVTMLSVGVLAPLGYGSAGGDPENTAPTEELVLVYVYNDSAYYVEFYVDGDYKTGIDPGDWATVAVEVGERTFFSDKAGDGIDSAVVINVPSGGYSYHIH